MERTKKQKQAGLIEGSDNAIFIDKDAFENNYKVLRTKIRGCAASVMFVFETEQQALEAGRKIAIAIGGECYGINDPRK